MSEITRPVLRYHGGKFRTEVVWINEACAVALERQRSQQRMFE